MIAVQQMTDQIDQLLNVYTALRARSQYDDLSDLHEEATAYSVRLRAAIERLAPGQNTYAQEKDDIVKLIENNKLRIGKFVGILQALRTDAANGWLEGISELIHADTFSDLLDQAAELIDKSYKDAAAVVAGSALETHIRLLCDRFSVSTTIPSGAPKKADTMNAELVKAGAYNTLQQKAVTAWLGIRNAAAHGECGKYTAADVNSMINSVRDFVLRYPA